MKTGFTFNSDLIEDLARRRVVLFIGAGASKSATPRAGGSFKDWTEFLTEACSKIADNALKRKILTRIKDKDYLIASEVLKANIGHDQWIRLLSNEFQQAAAPSPLHKALISLDQRIIVTTNFDKLIENAWSEVANRYANVISSVDEKAFRLFRNDEPYLIKLHGSIDEPAGIIFDKTSYQRAAFANQFYRELIGTLLLTHTFIFVGFSMDDPAIQSVVESYAFRYYDSRPHYIFSSGKPDETMDELSRRMRKLFVIRYSSANGHAALVQALEQLSQETSERRRHLVASNS